jgi:hypothetical protein
MNPRCTNSNRNSKISRRSSRLGTNTPLETYSKPKRNSWTKWASYKVKSRQELSEDHKAQEAAISQNLEERKSQEEIIW